MAPAKPDVDAEGQETRCAFVFVLYGPGCEDYLFGAATAALSLLRHRTAHRIVLMHTPDVPKQLIVLARELGLFGEVIPTEYVEASPVFFDGPVPHQRFGKIFTKYRVLALTQYKKVLLLDTDLFIRGNIDSLFGLDAPAAMQRGPSKPPRGQRLQARAPINAGVMLLEPSASLLEEFLAEITGPSPRKLKAYNSPDADFLTEHEAYRGEWSSIPLTFNFQLEFCDLRLDQGTVTFSPARQEHFSTDGMLTPWQEVRVAHFSGMKPWKAALHDCVALMDLRVTTMADREGSEELGRKLREGLREYATACAAAQSLWSEIGLGEGVLWRQRKISEVVLDGDPESVRRRVAKVLGKKAGESAIWVEGLKPQTVNWCPAGDLPPVPHYLELRLRPAAGDLVRRAGGDDPDVWHVDAVAGHPQEGVAQLSLQDSPMPAPWEHVEDSQSKRWFWHNKSTGETTWNFPGQLPGWVYEVEDNRGIFLNESTGETAVRPATMYDQTASLPVSDLEVLVPAKREKPETEVVYLSRSFCTDTDGSARLRKAMLSLGAVRASGGAGRS